MTRQSEAFNELLSLMELEPLEDNLFRGVSRDIGTERVFGGQVLAQALLAASQTVEDRQAHSLHAYFLRAGDHKAPIVYSVDRSRDGRSFSARRVVAIQHGRPIFTLAASFQVEEEERRISRRNQCSSRDLYCSQSPSDRVPLCNSACRLNS